MIFVILKKKKKILKFKLLYYLNYIYMVLKLRFMSVIYILKPCM